MADVQTDDGEEGYWRHVADDCGPGPCPYCEIEDDDEERAYERMTENGIEMEIDERRGDE